MINNEEIKFAPITEEDFLRIATALNQDPEVKQFIQFYDKNSTIAIELGNQIIGLCSIIRFIGNNLAVHTALLKNYRNKGLGGIIFYKIAQEYGKLYPKSEKFIANIDYRNQRAIQSLEKKGINRTDRFDELMNEEGGNFYIIYELDNPCYHKKFK